MFYRADFLLTLCRYVLACTSVLIVASVAQAQFTTVIDVPPDVAPMLIESDTQLNLFEGGTLTTPFFDAGLLDGTSTNVEVNVFGGSTGPELFANPGSQVFFMGGQAVDLVSNGGLIEVSGGVVLSSVSSGGSPNGGESLAIITGGEVNEAVANPLFFNFGSTARLRITGGQINGDVEASSEGRVELLGGTILGSARVQAGATLLFDNVDIGGGNGIFLSNVGAGAGDLGGEADILGGTVGLLGLSDGNNNFPGGTANLFGGEIDQISAGVLTNVNVFGTEFLLDGVDITGSITAGVPLPIVDRGVTLSGVLSDGTAFSYELNTSTISGQDLFDPTASLTVNLVDADFDGDGDIDGVDFLAWQRGFGTDAGAGNAVSPAQGNANGDQFVDTEDLTIWRAQFGSSPASSEVAAVPEPGGLVLVMVGLPFVAVRRR